MKRKLPLDLFDELARDPDEGIRQRIAYNAKTPASILEKLAFDESPLVAERARERLKRLAGPT